MRNFRGFWVLMFIDLVAIIFLIHWWATEGMDWLRDGLLIGIFGALNITIIFTQGKK